MAKDKRTVENNKVLKSAYEEELKKAEAAAEIEIEKKTETQSNTKTNTTTKSTGTSTKPHKSATSKARYRHNYKRSAARHALQALPQTQAPDENITVAEQTSQTASSPASGTETTAVN